MITLICGPMYSGKSTEMVRRLERSYIAKKKVVLIRPKIDSRRFLNHSKQNFSWLNEEFVKDLMDFNTLDYDVIGIDEGQFHKNLIDFCKVARHNNKSVVVAALHSTSECEMFDPIIELIPHCEEIVKLNAVCTSCGDDWATYTYFLAGDKKDKVAVGGSKEYTALCAKCYENKIKEKVGKI